MFVMKFYVRIYHIKITCKIMYSFYIGIVIFFSHLKHLTSKAVENVDLSAEPIDHICDGKSSSRHAQSMCHLQLLCRMFHTTSVGEKMGNQFGDTGCYHILSSNC